MIELFYAVALSISGGLILLELLYASARGRRLHGLVDSLSNLVLYAGFFAINLVWAHVVFAIYVAASDHALIHLTTGAWHIGNNGLWWEWLLLFVLEDLCFYAFHRASHRVNFFWASHVTHHSSRFFNLTVAFRQTWVPFPAVLFWIPLLLLGFDPLMVMGVQVISLAYQELLHTQALPRLGPLEWILNTPNHHAVHHGSNEAYLDKNYGGVLIVWDRLFGTFAERSEEIRFGLTRDIQSNNPVFVALHGWWELIAEAWRSHSVRSMFAPPKR